MGQDRLRVWVFGRVEHEELRDRYDKNRINGLGDDRFVIVRADMVRHEDFNVIIPVDAENDEGLEEAKSVLTEQLGV